MKILFCPCHYVFDDGDRGSELSWAYQIAQRIAAKNTESVVVTGFKNLKKQVPFEVIPVQPYKKEVDLSLYNSLVFNFLYSQSAFRLLNERRFDIVHHVLPFGIDRTFNFSFYFSKVPKVIGPIQNQLPVYADNIHDVSSLKKSILTIIIEKIISFTAHPVLKSLSEHTLKRADTIVVINDKTKNMLIKRNIDGRKIVVIPPGIDCNNFTVGASPKQKGTEILVVGALIKRKGFDVLFKGIAEVSKINKNFTLRVLGDGPQRKNLEELAKNLGIAHVIKFEGHVPHYEMGKYYKKADIFVNMSRAEGFATICLEAMASGLAIVSSKVGGFEDAIKDGVNGYLVEQEDYKTLAIRINSLLNNKKNQEKIGLKARKDAEKYYDWDAAIIPKYLKVYAKLSKQL